MSRFDNYGWTPYVPVAKRRANALMEMQKLRKNGTDICPVEPIKGRAIAKTFWGEGWCKHLEQFSDYENRLPRGRTYVRNGSVCHLSIEQGKINAIVSGSDLYEIEIKIKTMPQGKWDYIRKNCTGRIGSLLQLLQGKFSDEVMQVVTDRDNGLFPLPGEMTFECSCPDWAVMCKHVAAVLYGVGARLDKSPELLFKLRGVDHEELIGSEAIAAVTGAATTAVSSDGRRRMKGSVSAIFGVELEEPEPEEASAIKAKSVTAARKTSRKPVRKASSKTAKKTTPQVNIAKSPAKSKTKSKAKSPGAIAGKKSAVKPAAKPMTVVAEEARSKKLTGAMVKRLRAKMKLSAARFGEQLGVSAQTVYNWERTRGALSIRNESSDRLRKLLRNE